MYKTDINGTSIGSNYGLVTPSSIPDSCMKYETRRGNCSVHILAGGRKVRCKYEGEGTGVEVRVRRVGEGISVSLYWLTEFYKLTTI